MNKKVLLLSVIVVIATADVWWFFSIFLSHEDVPEMQQDTNPAPQQDMDLLPVDANNDEELSPEEDGEGPLADEAVTEDPQASDVSDTSNDIEADNQQQIDQQQEPEEQEEEISIFSQEADEDGTLILAKYDVTGTIIDITGTNNNASGDDLVYRDAFDQHDDIWEYVIKVISPAYLDDINEFFIASDGPEETLASVEIDKNNLPVWIISVDPADVFDTEGDMLDDREFLATLIHEFAHIITTDSDQINFDTSLIAMEEGDGLDDRIFELEQLCGTYVTTEGCSRADSYLNLFFETFWGDGLYEEFNESDPDEFYDLNADEFVTDYAATNPEEDIAESWMFYVLGDDPGAGPIADEKIDFFTQFPELVSLRTFIRGNIASVL